MIPEQPKCIRCGVCCITAPACIKGSTEETETGFCSYLTIHKEGYTSCKYIEENGNIFPGGCWMRRKVNLREDIYEHLKDQAEKRVGIKLIGIGNKGRNRNRRALA